MLLSGALAWLLGLISALNVYVLSLDGNWDNWSWPIVLTALITSFTQGLKDLAAFLARPPEQTKQTATQPEVVTQTQVTTQSERVPDIQADKNAIDLALLKAEIKREEGEVLEVYLDHLGNPTLGIGHLIIESDPEHGMPVGTPVAQDRVNALFANDVANAIDDAERLVDDFESMPQTAKHVLIQMVFQMGYTGVKKFKQTRRYFNARNWRLAASEMLDSDWYRRDTPTRALRLSSRIESLAGPEIQLG